MLVSTVCESFKIVFCRVLQIDDVGLNGSDLLNTVALISTEQQLATLMYRLIVALIVTISAINASLIGATAPWDPWDVSPATLEITGIYCIFGPLQLLQLGGIFFAGHCGKLTVLSQTSLLSLRRREGKKSREGNGNG